MDDAVMMEIQSLGDAIRDMKQQLKDANLSAQEIKNYAPLQEMCRELDQMKLDNGINPKTNKPLSGGDGHGHGSGGHGGKRDRDAKGFAHRSEKLQMELLNIAEIAQDAVEKVTQKRHALEKEFQAVRDQMDVQRATLEDLEIERDNLNEMLERKRQQQQQRG